jgi:hypothetical protein
MSSAPDAAEAGALPSAGPDPIVGLPAGFGHS